MFFSCNEIHWRCFVLFFLRQARLDSTVVLDQALFLPSPVFSSHTRRVQDRLHSILLPGNTRSIIGRNIPPRKMTKMYIDNLKSVTETYKVRKEINQQMSWWRFSSWNELHTVTYLGSASPFSGRLLQEQELADAFL